jgi:hypothetical protein
VNLKRAVLAIVCILGFFALASAVDRSYGTWKLDLAKSTYKLGPAPQSSTQRIEAVEGGERTITDTVDAQGRSLHIEFTAKYDGKDYPVKGDPTRDAIAITKIDDYTHQFTNKKDGKTTTTGRSVTSKDGKLRSNTVTGIDAQGRQVSNITVWERQ